MPPLGVEPLLGGVDELPLGGVVVLPLGGVVVLLPGIVALLSGVVVVDGVAVLDGVVPVVVLALSVALPVIVREPLSDGVALVFGSFDDEFRAHAAETRIVEATARV